MELGIPARYRATVGSPAGPASAITVNGIPARATPVRRYQTDFDAIELDPGSYLLRADPADDDSLRPRDSALIERVQGIWWNRMSTTKPSF